LSCGAEIGEINTVRKHLSRVKGGRLGQFFAPGKVISLIISDVVGNDLNTIASGLTCPDATTYQDAWDVVSRYDLLAAAPPGVIAFLSRGCRNEIEETPKALGNCHNHIIGDNRLALEAMARQAEAMGLRPHIVTAAQKGDTAGVARLRAEEVREGKYAGYGVVLIGGETTPSLPPSPGWGGRNQHYVAVSLLAMQNFPGGWVIASVGTDGTDYLPEVAGAIIDDDSFAEARACGLDVPSYVERFDSYNLLARMGKSLLVMGNTGTNVGDIIVYRLR